MHYDEKMYEKVFPSKEEKTEESVETVVETFTPTKDEKEEFSQLNESETKDNEEREEK